MARAVYARKRIAIFDDVLSGLDAGTEEFVFSNVFGPHGLLKKTNTTSILVTHASKSAFMDFCTQADYRSTPNSFCRPYRCPGGW